MMTPANGALILVGEAEEERERIAGAGGKERKYEYTVNENHATGEIKDRFIWVIYTAGKVKRRRLMEGEIERVVPVRPGHGGKNIPIAPPPGMKSQRRKFKPPLRLHAPLRRSQFTTSPFEPLTFLPLPL